MKKLFLLLLFFTGMSGFAVCSYAGDIVVSANIWWKLYRGYSIEFDNLQVVILRRNNQVTRVTLNGSSPQSIKIPGSGDDIEQIEVGGGGFKFTQLMLWGKTVHVWGSINADYLKEQELDIKDLKGNKVNGKMILQYHDNFRLSKIDLGVYESQLGGLSYD